MTTEIINIQVREDGSRVVTRNIDGIGGAAKRASSPVSQLKLLLGTLVTGAAVAQLARLADEYTNLQNRLRLVTTDAGNLARINKELLTISNQTRSDLAATSELYFRLASNTKELGLSQQELLGFTKSVNQAIILSGASSAEAAGGLRQLAQGIASNTLRGEELNSVLENLPKVAQIIRDGMGVTIGQMREMAAEGKISAKVIVDAFKKAGGDLEAQFGNSVPSISQSLTVLKNNLLVFIGETDQAYGISAKLSKGILFLADNLDELASALVTIAKLTVTATTAYLAYEGAIKAGAFVTAARQAIAYHTAIARGTVVVLGSAEAERQRAVYALEAARSAEAASAIKVQASIAEARSTVVATQARVADMTATQAAIAVAREDAVAKLAASNAAIVSAKRTIAATEAVGALSYALALNKAATMDLTAAEAARSLALKELAVLGTQQARVAALTTEALTAQTAAQTALTAAQQRGAAAAAAAAATTAQAATTATAATAAAAGSTTLLGMAVAKLKLAFASLWAFIAANPIALLITALVAATVAIVMFRDQIKLGVDETTTLGDLMRAVWETVAPAVKAAGDAVAQFFSWLTSTSYGTFDEMINHIVGYEHASEALWLKMVRIVIQVFDMIGGVTRGTMAGMLAVVTKVIVAMMNSFEQLGNAFTAATNFDGEALLAAVNSSRKGWEMAGTDIGGTFGAAFAKEQLNQAENGLEAGFDSLIKRAQEISKARQPGAAPDGPLAPASPGAAPTVPVDADAAKKAARELEKLKNELAQILDQADPIAAAQRRLAEAQDVLTRSVKAGLITQTDANKVMEELKFQLRDQLDPLAALNRELDENISLLKMSNDTRRVEGDLLQFTEQLRRDGVKLTEEETAALRAKLIVEQELERIAQSRDSLQQNSAAGKREQISIDMQAFDQLKEQMTSGDQFNFLNQMLGGSLDETQAAFDARIEQFQMYYEIIEEFRQLDVANEALASEAKKAIKQQEMDMYIDATAAGLGQIAQLMGSQNKKAFKIGQAAAIAQVAIKTPQAAMDAYSSLAGIPYVGPFLGAAAAAAAVLMGVQQISKIRSQQPPAYRTGGSYTVGGTGGVDSQMVSLRATPGERININTPAQARALERMGEERMNEDRPTRIQQVTQNIVIQGRPDKRTPEQYARAANLEARREYDRS